MTPHHWRHSAKRWPTIGFDLSESGEERRLLAALAAVPVVFNGDGMRASDVARLT